MFTACYYFSYKHALNEFNKKAVERNEDLLKYLANNDGNLPDENNTQDTTVDNGKETVLDNSSDNTLLVDNMEEIILLPTTVYKLQLYNAKTGEITEETLPIPSYLIGLNRQEVLDYLKDYVQDLPLHEFEKGLQSFQLLVFNEEELVLRKTYNEDKVVYKYYLKAEDGYIVAYYGDKKTVFDYTSVSVDKLSPSDRQALEEGILVKDLEQLYGLLEHYSS